MERLVEEHRNANASIAGNEKESTAKDIKKILRDRSISATEREALIKARLGQGRFRRELINIWQGCAVTKCRATSVLRASHIKPWRDCNSNAERLDPFNGLLLLPNLDALFDCKLISFDKDGKILVSKQMTSQDHDDLGISTRYRFAIRAAHKPYLTHHRKEFRRLEKHRKQSKMI